MFHIYWYTVDWYHASEFCKDARSPLHPIPWMCACHQSSTKYWKLKMDKNSSAAAAMWC